MSLTRVSVERRRPLCQAPMWLAIASTLFGLLLAFLLKEPCLSRPIQRGSPFPRFCYSDIQPFAVRGLAAGLPYRDYRLEYPVLTGVFIKATGLLVRRLGPLGVSPTSGNYFTISALFLAPFALVTTLLLRPRVTRGRLMLWSMGTPLVFHAFLNWDLIAVAAGVWGLVEAERRRETQAGTAFALGASAKLFPMFFLPGAALERWAIGDRRGTARLLAAFVLIAAAVNIPWMILAPRGWLATWQFHAARDPDLGTVWSWLGRHGRELFPSSWWIDGGFRDAVSLIGLVGFAAGAAWFLWRGWRRRSEDQGYPVAATGLGIVAVFLLLSKVHSPQYALWVIPLLALLDVPWWLVFTYLAGDAMVFVSAFAWFSLFAVPSPQWIYESAVLLRAAALAGLAWWASRATRLLAADPLQERDQFTEDSP
jgi:uncharacterized membrane protein